MDEEAKNVDGDDLHGQPLPPVQSAVQSPEISNQLFCSLKFCLFYWPLTIIVAFSGLFSRLLNSRLATVVECHQLLGEIQQGFRKTRRGSANSFILNTVIQKATSEGKKVHMAFLDLHKAYDTVSRPLLWSKMEKMGLGGNFFSSIKALYNGDNFVTTINGVRTRPIYLGRGLRQGCSLSPILFALYIMDWGNDVNLSGEGFKLGGVVISGLFFADDVILLSRTAEGLKRLLDLSSRNVKALKMSISGSKSQVISGFFDTWDLYDDDDNVFFSLAKVLQYKYLGIDTFSTMSRISSAKQAKCVATARRYQTSCLKLSKRGPDTVDLGASLWTSIAMKIILFGCETMPIDDTTIKEVERIQSQVAKSLLGLGARTPNICAQTELGFKFFRHQLFYLQLSYYMRLLSLEKTRWAHKALMEHVEGGWSSSYLRHITKIRTELGLFVLPSTNKELEAVLEQKFLAIANSTISALKSVTAVDMLSSFSRCRHVLEGSASSAVSEVQMGALSLRVRRGVAYHEMCRFCGVPNSALHLVTTCLAMSRLRRQTGISVFLGQCNVKGITLDRAFYLYVNELTTDGDQLFLSEFLDRGRALHIMLDRRIQLNVDL